MGGGKDYFPPQQHWQQVQQTVQESYVQSRDFAKEFFEYLAATIGYGKLLIIVIGCLAVFFTAIIMRFVNSIKKKD